ncbi:MurR/RpiR family transcriptional regulator [Paraliobacillus sp. JSM ZJ581]|uniref:MurR/RpiR family transcriptional regulator n=1 Tax=Paraliobacillus sp. JSM ZJ581 TaxID=3342118 RepID=UPI0035A8EA51
MSLFKHFQENQHLLNEQESKLLSYLMDNINDIKTKTLKTVSNELYVSPNTIVRMAKKLEFRGYTELKIAIEIENSQAKTLNKEKNLSLYDQIKQTDKLLTSELIEATTQKLLEANQVFFLVVALPNFLVKK